MKRFLFSLIILITGILLVPAQTDPKLDKQFEKAVAFYESRKPDDALNLLDKLLKSDPGYIKAYLLQGEIYADAKKDKSKAIAAYQKLLSVDSTAYPAVNFTLGTLLMDMERYGEALLCFSKILQNESIRIETRTESKKNMQICEFRNQRMLHPVSFHPENVGEAINSTGYEFVNAVSSDENSLYFTRRAAQGGIETFFVSKRNPVSHLWENAQMLPPPLNSENTQGALVFSPDFRFAFITRCNARDSYGSCDLYVSKRIGDTFTEPQNLGEVVNSPKWDSQPSFSGDGKSLFFASQREGGFGGSDIWVTYLHADGSWSTPKNLGEAVNSPKDEMCPFIHPDGRTLYFSSRGLPGMGGADLFMTKMNADGTFQKAQNLGYPINTKLDEINFIVTAHENRAYYSRQTSESNPTTDIYSFELPAEVRPEPLLIFTGRTFDSITRQPIGANFEFIDVKTNQQILQSYSDPKSGKFELFLPPNHLCAVNITKPGYLFYSETFSFEQGDSAKTVFVDFYLSPIQVGEKVVLKNIFFETDRYDLKPESFAELEKLAEFLKKNTQLNIELSGHTDNQGSTAHNLTLSQNRAMAVYNFLLEKGISKSRLSYKGYGETQPVAPNTTEAGRQANRRTEFKVLGN